MTDQLVALAREAEQLTKENIDLRHKLRAAESRLTQLEGALRQADGCGGLCKACQEVVEAALTPVVKQEEP